MERLNEIPGNKYDINNFNKIKYDLYEDDLLNFFCSIKQSNTAPLTNMIFIEHSDIISLDINIFPHFGIN